jgi:hypothetical protein
VPEAEGPTGGRPHARREGFDRQEAHRDQLHRDEAHRSGADDVDRSDVARSEAQLAAALTRLADLRQDAEAVMSALQVAATAHATNVRAAAERDAASILQRARRDHERQRADAEALAASTRIQAGDALREAEATREQAKRLLVRARARAGHLVAEAEHQAAGLLTDAEAAARARTTAALRAGRAQLDLVEAEERRARHRLLEIHAAFDVLAHRFVGSEPIIDLTGEQAVVRGSSERAPTAVGGARTDRRAPSVTPSRLSPAPTITTPAPRSAARPPTATPPHTPTPDPGRAVGSVGRGWATPSRPPRRRRTDRDPDPAAVAASGERDANDGTDRAPSTLGPDPLSFMIRRAVDRAVANSGRRVPRVDAPTRAPRSGERRP